MEKLFCALREALVRGEDAVLCSIIASSGSTPRGSGAKMAVFSGGDVSGTVGGGAVEYESIKLARQALITGETFTKGFNLTHSQTADIGMICGGQVVVYFQYFPGKDERALEFADRIVQLFSEQQDTWLVTEIAEGECRGMGVYTAEGTPLCSLGKAIGGDILPQLLAKAVLVQGEPSYYAEPLTRAARALVFGGGHVSQELVPVISHLGFPVVLFEDREAFATAELFPNAVRRIVGDYRDIAARVSITAADYVIIMTRGHQGDFQLLFQALQSEAAYIGVIGSRHKIAETNRRLLEAGIAQGELSRVHTPIGLEIGAQTPAEIAISVAAELILHRARIAENNE